MFCFSVQHNYEAEKKQRIDEIAKLQEQLDSHQAAETTTDHQLDQFRSAVTKYKNDQYNLVYVNQCSPHTNSV